MMMHPNRYGLVTEKSISHYRKALKYKRIPEFFVFDTRYFSTVGISSNDRVSFFIIIAHFRLKVNHGRLSALKIFSVSFLSLRIY